MLALGIRLLPITPDTVKVPVMLGLWLTSNVIESEAALPVIIKLLAVLKVTVPVAELATTLVPLAEITPNALPVLISNVSAVVPMVIGSLVVSFHEVSA